VNTANASQGFITGNIVFIQCDPSNSSDLGTIFQTSTQHNPAAVILYSTTANWCSYTPGTFINAGFSYIYSTTSSHDILNLYTARDSAGTHPLTVFIAKNSTFANMSQSQNSGNSNPNSTPGGPSPSTAVAMIILYSITGVITALFLIIIITGAIRAHRHPERYGPRNVLGRPRQSRARGLGRAILETIPVVKFGEKEEAKPGDLEMTAGSREGDNAVRSESAGSAVGDDTMTRATPENEEETAGASPGITAAATPSPEPEAEEENQNCSICTEDFEKGQDVRVLPCKHSYHPACIDPWLLNVSGTCPLW
jgi:RING-like zinc finger